MQVVRDGDLVAVLHEHWDDADKALALVKAEWTRHDPPVDDKTMYDHFRKTAGPARTAAEGGNLAEGEKLAADVVEGTYYDSYVAHAPMEPHSATAAVENGKVTVWAGTQTPFPVKNQLIAGAEAAGRQGAGDHAVRRRRVRGQVGVAAGGRGGAAGDADGQARARGLQSPGGVLLRHLPPGVDRADSRRPDRVEDHRALGLHGLLRGRARRGTLLQHPNHKTAWTGGWSGNSGALHPFAVGPWRAPGASSNAFGRESHIDVLAAKAGMDPVEFRLKNLSDARMVRAR